MSTGDIQRAPGNQTPSAAKVPESDSAKGNVEAGRQKDSGGNLKARPADAGMSTFRKNGR